jgi:hypothetical protein
MKIKIGDQVRFLNEVGGGRVTSIVNKDMVNVETDDGFEVPTLTRELVVVSGDIYNEHEETNTLEAEVDSHEEEHEKEPEFHGFVDINQTEGNDKANFIFAIVPDNATNPIDGEIKLFLINDCNYTVLYQYVNKTDNTYETVGTGTLEPNTKIELDKISGTNLSELPVFCFQLLFFRRQSNQLEQPVQKEISINPVRFYKQNSFTENNYFHNPAMIFSLVESQLKAELNKLTGDDFKKIVREKEQNQDRKKPQGRVPIPELLEIDLHINELLDSTTGLSNSEMLNVQIDKFNEEMQNAIKSKVKKIVFIHGLGNGTLKSQLRRELQRNYKKYPFQDASFKEYGYGATMVVIRK